MMIRLKNVWFSYNNKRNAVRKITFDVPRGSYVTIAGENGSGKSTVAKLIAGLLEPKMGEIYIDGLKLCEENLKKIREKLVIVFQNPDNQFIGSTVRDDIAFGLENRQVKPEDMDSIIREIAYKTGVDRYLNREPSNLSGGQKQRVAIAGALAMNPDIIIFDEATSMLDPKSKSEIKELMRELHKDKRLTIVSITHDLDEIIQSDDCLVMSEGEVFFHKRPEDIFKRFDELYQLSLEIPFIEQAREEFRKEGIEIKSKDLMGAIREICQYTQDH